MMMSPKVLRTSSVAIINFFHRKSRAIDTHQSLLFSWSRQRGDLVEAVVRYCNRHDTESPESVALEIAPELIKIIELS